MLWVNADDSLTYGPLIVTLFLQCLQTNARFLEEFELLSLPVTRYAPQTYDAVWAMALAMRGAREKWKTSKLPIKLHQFDYSRKDMTEEFLSQLEQLEFLGVSVSSMEHFVQYIN
jgi:gamma-aminobutyric acid type B receptor